MGMFLTAAIPPVTHRWEPCVTIANGLDEIPIRWVCTSCPWPHMTHEPPPGDPRQRELPFPSEEDDEC